MTRPNWPPIPADRVVHTWSCTRRSPLVTVERGDGTTFLRCTGCGGSDDHDGGEAA